VAPAAFRANPRAHGMGVVERRVTSNFPASS
jgi:hypothetical protein